MPGAGVWCACGCGTWVERKAGRQRKWASRGCFARDPALAEFRRRRVAAMVAAAVRARRRRMVQDSARYHTRAQAMRAGYRRGASMMRRWWRARYRRLLAELIALRARVERRRDVPR